MGLDTVPQTFFPNQPTSEFKEESVKPKKKKRIFWADLQSSCLYSFELVMWEYVYCWWNRVREKYYFKNIKKLGKWGQPPATVHARLFGLVEWFLAAVLSTILAVLCLCGKLGLLCVSICGCILPFFVDLGQEPQVLPLLERSSVIIVYSNNGF